MDRAHTKGRERLVFTEAGEWAAKQACDRFLAERGFSVGSPQAGSPRGVLFGDYSIQKWRNLRPADRDALHALVTGDGRYGPITVTILDACPVDGRAALAKAEGLGQRADATSSSGPDSSPSEMEGA